MDNHPDLSPIRTHWGIADTAIAAAIVIAMILPVVISSF
jgi:hypothetical protein